MRYQQVSVIITSKLIDDTALSPHVANLIERLNLFTLYQFTYTMESQGQWYPRHFTQVP